MALLTSTRGGWVVGRGVLGYYLRAFFRDPLWPRLVVQHDEGGGVTSRLVEGAEYDERDNVVDL